MARTTPPGTEQHRDAVQLTTLSCESIADAEPQALGISYRFDTPRDGEPFSVSVRFVGRRVGTKRKPGPHDSFNTVETIDRVVPGSGPVTLTTRLLDVTPGEWSVTATATTGRQGRVRTKDRAHYRLPTGSSSGTTILAPVARVLAPGAHLGVWPLLVSVGAVVALATQYQLARHAGLPSTRILLISLAASLVGLVTAKLYYVVEHHGSRPSVLTAGMCIQGFVLGALAVLAFGAAATDLSPGQVLDVTTPGLLFGMAIGRYGCFFGGCCAGRPTASRWGLWSSDRRIGVRRIPTQLLESTAALAIGLVALWAVWATPPEPAGTVFVGAIAAYTFARQLLFPLRDLPRHTAHGRSLVAAISATVAIVAGAVTVLR